MSCLSKAAEKARSTSGPNPLSDRSSDTRAWLSCTATAMLLPPFVPRPFFSKFKWQSAEFFLIAPAKATPAATPSRLRDASSAVNCTRVFRQWARYLPPSCLKSLPAKPRTRKALSGFFRNALSSDFAASRPKLLSLTSSDVNTVLYLKPRHNCGPDDGVLFRVNSFVYMSLGPNLLLATFNVFKEGCFLRALPKANPAGGPNRLEAMEKSVNEVLLPSAFANSTPPSSSMLFCLRSKYVKAELRDTACAAYDAVSESNLFALASIRTMLIG